MLVHDNRAAGQCAAPAHLVDLQGEALEADGVVATYSALELQREDQVQVAARASSEGCAALRRRHLEAAITCADVMLAQEAIGL